MSPPFLAPATGGGRRTLAGKAVVAPAAALAPLLVLARPTFGVLEPVFAPGGMDFLGIGGSFAFFVGGGPAPVARVWAVVGCVTSLGEELDGVESSSSACSRFAGGKAAPFLDKEDVDAFRAVITSDEAVAPFAFPPRPFVAEEIIPRPFNFEDDGPEVGASSSALDRSSSMTTSGSSNSESESVYCAAALLLRLARFFDGGARFRAGLVAGFGELGGGGEGEGSVVAGSVEIV